MSNVGCVNFEAHLYVIFTVLLLEPLSFRFPAVAQNLSLRNVQIRPGAHPVCWSARTRDCFCSAWSWTVTSVYV